MLMAAGVFLGKSGQTEPEPDNRGIFVMDHQWNGKKIAFLGDSITDAAHIGTTRNYWQFLAEMLDFTPLVFGINGQNWGDIPSQIGNLQKSGTDADAIIVFAGTNDYNSGCPIGDWWEYRDETTNANGIICQRRRRLPCFDNTTFCGRINVALDLLKKNYPHRQIIVLTPVHRGFAAFSEENIQPEESYPNRLGLYLDTYVDKLKECGDIWSVPVINLYALSGLYPMQKEYAAYFADAGTDLLHPNIMGHWRIAQTLYYQLKSLPVTDFSAIPQ